MDKLEKIDNLCAEVLLASSARIGTHWDDCYLCHSECLAAHVKDILVGKA